MKKTILILLVLILITIPVWANAGPPAQDPQSNMVYFTEDSGVSLIEEWITFTIKEERNQIADVGVKYILKNIDNKEEKIKLMFLGPGLYADDAKIYSNGELIEDIKFIIKSELPSNWESTENINIYEPISGKLLNEGLTGFDYGLYDNGYEFSVDIPLDETIELDILYQSDGGFYSFDKVMNDVSTHIYYLTPAKYWEGKAKVNMSVVFPDDSYEIYSNIGLEEINDNTYGTILEEIPEEEWYFNYVRKEGLILGTNLRTTNNIIVAVMVALTLALGIYFKKKNKKLFSVIAFILILPEILLLRLSYGSAFFMLFIFGPIILLIIIITIIAKLYFRKKENKL